MPFLTYDPFPQCLQPSPLTPLLLARVTSEEVGAIYQTLSVSDQVQVGGVLGLEHELQARMQQAEQQHVGGAVDGEVVEHGVDPLDRGIDPGFDLAQEVDPVDGGAALVGQGEGGTGRGLEGAEHVAGDATPAVVDLLPGALRLGPGWLDEPLARIALGRPRPHLVQADYDAA